MMKILLLLPRFDRRKWDTLTDQAWNLARLITAGGEAQCVIAAGRSQDEAALEVVNDVPIYRFKSARKRNWLHWFRRGDEDIHGLGPGMEIFLRKNDFDIVHLLCSGSMCRRASEILYERKKPYVVYCRSEEVQLYDEAEPFKGGRPVSFSRRFRGYGDALKYAARIFCGDQKVRRLLAAKLGDRRLLVWQPGVDVERFPVRPGWISGSFINCLRRGK